MEMGWRCKKHGDENKQLDGVCPFCLRERLSQLAAASHSQLLKFPSPSSSSSNHPAAYYSSASSSNSTSPARGRHTRNVSEVIGSIAFMLSSGGSSGLKKSRSIASVPRNAFVGELNEKNAREKKGFWSKLLHRERETERERKRKEIFLRSRTVSVRETFA